MRMRSHWIEGCSTVFGLGVILSLVGCDYWPPALHAQIEQMRTETQSLAMEKAHLQGQVSDLSKVKQELQGQVEELSRINREKTVMIMSLQKQLDAVRIKAMKSMSSKTADRKTAMRSTGKSSTKAAPKSILKAPPTKQSASKEVGVR